MKLTIIPDIIKEKNSKDGSLYLSIKAGKNWYSVWNPDIFGFFFKGQEVSVEVVEKGDFKNIVDAHAIGPKETNEPDWEAIRKEKAEGQAKGAAFNKSVDIVIAMYQKDEIKSNQIVPMVKKVFDEFKEINLENGETIQKDAE